MALIVENGTGLVDADSYPALAAFKLYAGDRGIDISGRTDAQLEAALRNATDYIDTAYAWGGEKLTTTQALQWPRAGMEGVPGAVLKATMFLAAQALDGPLMAAQSAAVTQQRQKLDGVGETETHYSDKRRARFPDVDNMLTGLATRRGGAIQSIAVVRA